MKHILFVLIAVVSLLQVDAQNVRLTWLRTTKAPTNSWIYMPSGDSVTFSGLKSKMYPLKQTDDGATYLESEFIGVIDCDMTMDISYYTTTSTTKSIKIEMIDRQDNVVYSFVNDDFYVGSSLMAAETIKIGVLENVSSVKIRISLSKSNKSTEAINLEELQLYSTNGQDGVETILTNPQNIRVEGQLLMVESPKNSFLEVYSMTGALISKNAICKGANRIMLSSGLYLIKLDDYTQKVLIP